MKGKNLLYTIGDAVAVTLFNLCLLLLAIIVPALSIGGTPSWYQKQFEKTGIYATVDEDGTQHRTTIYYIGGKPSQRATFSDEQLNGIIDHIVNFLYTDQESFALTMDGVMLNGTLTDNVEIFGETSVGHMQDVKNLFRFFLVLGIVLFVVWLGAIAYGVWRWRFVKGRLLKYTLIFYGVFIALIGAFCLWVMCDLSAEGREITADNFADKLWDNFHHLIFPFQDDKFANSFFNDTLTSVLTLDFFLNAVKTVLAVVFAVLALWIGGIIALRIIEQKKAQTKQLE